MNVNKCAFTAARIDLARFLPMLFFKSKYQSKRFPPYDKTNMSLSFNVQTNTSEYLQ